MIAGIPCIISVLTTFILLLVSKKNSEYVSETNKLSKEQYPFKDFMPMGLLLADKVGIEKLKVKNKELYEKIILCIKKGYFYCLYNIKNDTIVKDKVRIGGLKNDK